MDEKTDFAKLNERANLVALIEQVYCGAAGKKTSTHVAHRLAVEIMAAGYRKRPDLDDAMAERTP